MATQEAVKLLKKTSLFGQFSEKELEALFSTAKVREFESGSTIVREGDPAGVGFYLVLDGQVEVRKGQKVLAKLGPGDYFGEMALILEAPRSADVVAVQKTKCLMITRWELRSIISAYPDVALKMMAELARRLSATNQALSE
ncbi:MAG: cyclic nucleotide-binding domain-containing protein [Candidatus Bipolaricaulota bacterium]|nr:cyclic nucleotide-binding domain-containing protein [Candidatus Bipolaricaulota bacterium]MDW8031395.1 cyclic nucleotide-binding domain-containing protein [Candidatus Bipolaricaulota bacterium]